MPKGKRLEEISGGRSAWNLHLAPKPGGHRAARQGMPRKIVTDVTVTNLYGIDMISEMKVVNPEMAVDVITLKVTKQNAVDVPCAKDQRCGKPFLL